MVVLRTETTVSCDYVHHQWCAFSLGSFICVSHHLLPYVHTLTVPASPLICSMELRRTIKGNKVGDVNFCTLFDDVPFSHVDNGDAGSRNVFYLKGEPVKINGLNPDA